MDVTTYFRAQAYNNAWSNHRLHRACGRLSADDLVAKRTSFFPSITHTLNHILTVDWYYVSALEGDCIGYAAFDPEVPCPGFAELVREQRAVDRRLIAVCAEIDAAGLAATAVMIRDGWTQSERADRTLLHLFQHQIHHRGQVHAMLAGTAADPPQLDEFFSDSERVLREADFAELGFDETEIWNAATKA